MNQTDITALLNRQSLSDANLFSNFSGFSGNGTKFNITADLAVYSNADNAGVAASIKSGLQSAGWNVGTASGYWGSDNMFHFNCDVITNTTYTIQQIKDSFTNSVNSFLVPNGDVLVWGLNVIDISTGTTSNPNPTPSPNSAIPIPAPAPTDVLGDYLKNVDGSYFKDSTGKCVRESSGFLGMASVNCPADSASDSVSSFLSQIGGFFGFDKPNSTLGGLGLTAVAGGAVVLVAVLILAKRN